jgi:hypothetical protein
LLSRRFSGHQGRVHDAITVPILFSRNVASIVTTGAILAGGRGSGDPNAAAKKPPRRNVSSENFIKLRPDGVVLIAAAAARRVRGSSRMKWVGQ